MAEAVAEESAGAPAATEPEVSAGEAAADFSPLPPPAPRASPKCASLPELGSYKDLKQKTAFARTIGSGATDDPTYLHHISGFRSGPKFSMAHKGECSFIKYKATPAPGSYNLRLEEDSKHKNPPKFSFTSSSRFGLGENPTKKMPGPGAYNPRDPVMESSVKVAIVGSTRGRGPPILQTNPGPGAYDLRSSIGQGKMFTAGGRYHAFIDKTKVMPGPGAYNPSTSTALATAPKCGFGTSTRTEPPPRCAPGPGTYEMQNALGVGSSGPKYSATSRRTIHDLNSYLTPGPGSYNSHMTSFEVAPPPSSKQLTE